LARAAGRGRDGSGTLVAVTTAIEKVKSRLKLAMRGHFGQDGLKEK
jgi:hypothetical protein